MKDATENTNGKIPRDVFLLTHEARCVGEGRLTEYVLVRIVCVFQVGVQGQRGDHVCTNATIPWCPVKRMDLTGGIKADGQ